MAEARRTEPQQYQQQYPAQPREHGLLYNLVWGWPWKLVGVILASLMVSLVIEYVGIAFFWPEMGAAHSQAVMNTEFGYLSSDFTRSLLLSEPAATVTRWVTDAYQWAFVDSGIIGWIQQTYQAEMNSGNAVSRNPKGSTSWPGNYRQQYMLATVYVSIVTLIRVTIIALSVPLFVLVIGVAVVEGLGRRDLRRFGAGYESSFLYHRAKRLIKPAVYLPVMAYLSWPSAVYPNLLLLPAALMLGLTITITTASFKKYL